MARIKESNVVSPEITKHFTLFSSEEFKIFFWSAESLPIQTLFSSIGLAFPGGDKNDFKKLFVS